MSSGLCYVFFAGLMTFTAFILVFAFFQRKLATSKMLDIQATHASEILLSL